MLKKFQKFLLRAYQKRKLWKYWKMLLWLLMILTTFLTTYFLILPAITIEENSTNQVGIALESDTSTTQTAITSSEVKDSKNSQTQTSLSEIYQKEPLFYKGNGYKVLISFTEQAKIPQGSELRVEELHDSISSYKMYKDKALSEVEKKDQEIKNFKLYDITILFNGKEIEPQESVKVEVTYDEPLKVADEDLKIVHFKENGETEVLNSKDSEETKKASSDIAFKTDSFSIYAIVQTDNTLVPRYTYHFQNTDGSDYNFLTSSGLQIHHQIIKDGGILGEVGIPKIKAGEHFIGWYSYDPITGKYGQEVKFGVPIAVTETKEIYVRPYMSKVATVTLYDDVDGKNILEKYEVPLDDSGNGVADLSSYKVEPPTSTLLFVGWSKTPNGTVLSNSEIKSLNVSSDISLYPNFKESYKLDFETGNLSTGVTYISPERLLRDQLASTVKPQDPKRPGYAFAGWYTAPTNGQVFNFNQYLTKDTTIYAYWTPAQTQYTINYWQQSVTDSKTATDTQKTYEYAGQINKSAIALTTQNLTTYDINAKLTTGFKVNTNKTQTQVIVKDDGSSVVNVYYDRELVTMRFARTGYYESDYQSSTFPWTNGAYTETYTGLYGTTLAANGYQWKTGAWKYLTNSGVSGMSYLGEFILPSGVRGTNPYEIRLYSVSQRVQSYYFYKQLLGGSYSLADIGGGGGATYFTFTEKYLGFSVKYYQRLYPDNYLFDSTPQQTSSGVSVSIIDSSNSYLNLRVLYERLNYKIQYLDPIDNTSLANFPAKDVLYEANLSAYKPDTATVQPKPSRPGYVWDGKWYKDQALTQEFNFTGVMPAHDVKVYAGWTKIQYKINIDPNGGELPATDETYFNLYYGDKIPEYKNITRNYVEDASGTYYYKYDSRLKDPDGTKRAYYTADKTLTDIDTTHTYKYEKDAYKLVGWYYVNPDGSLRPYNFTGAVTQDINLRAIWRKVGDYHIIYSNDAVGLDGNPVIDSSGNTVKTTDEPIDSDKYADQSHSALLGRPTIPSAYRFRGWYYNGKIYNPYDTIIVEGHLADANKNITIKPVIVPIGDIKLEDTFIKYDGNGGSKILEGGNVVTQISSPHMELNSSVTLPENQYFTREGYNLIGWNHDKDLANRGHVEFKAGQEVGLDNNPDSSNTLYAVWKPKEYTITVTKKVIGNAEDKIQDFVFETSNSLQQANFALKDNENKVLLKVPYGTVISVNEQHYGDFKVSEEVTESNLASGEADKTYTVDGQVNIGVKGDVTIVYTNTRVKQKVALQKVNVENLNEPLEGAVFDLYASTSDNKKASTPLYKGIKSNQNGMLYVNDRDTFISLPLGKYYLTETQAPHGYHLSKQDMTLLVVETGVDFSQDGNNVTADKGILADGSLVHTFKVTNSKGTELPATGGIGAHLFILIGLLMTIPAGIILQRQRKKYNN